MITWSKQFDSGYWVFKCWDTNVEDVDNKLVKSVVSAFVDKNLRAGVVCATFKDGEIVAFTQMNNEHDYKRDMEMSLKFEQYEIAYFVKKYWDEIGSKKTGKGVLSESI